MRINVAEAHAGRSMQVALALGHRVTTRTWRRVLRLLPLLGSVACMPLPRQLFSPVGEGTDGQLKYSACSTRNVPESIEFKVEGIVVDVRVASVTDGRHYVEVRLTVPTGKVVALRDDKVAFQWPNHRPESYAVFERISLVDGPMVNMHKPDLRQYMKPIREPMVGYRNYWLATYVDPQPDDGFAIVLPSLVVNGTSLALPQVVFKKGPFVIAAPINC